MPRQSTTILQQGKLSEIDDVVQQAYQVIRRCQTVALQEDLEGLWRALDDLNHSMMILVVCHEGLRHKALT